MSETPRPQPFDADVARRVFDSAAPPDLMDARYPAPPVGCVDMPDLAPAYALGALEPDEARAVERHLLACPACARLVEEAERTAAVLPYLARPAVPAPDIKAALFTRIAHAQQNLSPAGRAATEAAPGAVTPNPNATLPPSRPWPGDERVTRRFRRPFLRALGGRRGAPAGEFGSASTQDARTGHAGWSNWPGPALPITTTTVPLMLVLVVVGGWAMRLNDKANEAATYQDLWGEVGSLLSADDGTVYQLWPEEDAPPGVRGQLIAEPDSAEAMVMVWGLDATTPDVVYQLWVERNDGLVPLSDGQLELNSRGNAQEIVRLDGRLDECQRVYVMALAPGREDTPVSILATTVSPVGPAAGGDGTAGEQTIGSLQVDLVRLAATDQGR